MGPAADVPQPTPVPMASDGSYQSGGELPFAIDLPVVPMPPKGTFTHRRQVPRRTDGRRLFLGQSGSAKAVHPHRDRSRHNVPAPKRLEAGDRSPANIASVWPLLHKASGSSLPASIACRAKRSASSISSSVSGAPATRGSRRTKPIRLAAGAWDGSIVSAWRSSRMAAPLPSRFGLRDSASARRYRSYASSIAVGLRVARSISARRNFGSIAPTTLDATWS
jgi:hypothetical protein